AGTAVSQELDAHESARALREPRAGERAHAITVAKGTGAAHELVARAAAGDHLERVVVPRRVNERRSARKRAIQGGTHAAVGRARCILARDPTHAGDWVDRTDQGQRDPEPRLDRAQGEDVLLPPEV